MDGVLVVLVVVAVVAAIVAVVLFQQARKRRIDASVQSLLARDPRWRRDDTLCGQTPGQLAGRTVATPRGDRRYGLEHVITGPLAVAALGVNRWCTASCGIWWYEEQSTSTDSDGHTTTTYSRRDTHVVAVVLPAAVPTELSIGSESVFGRIGLTRGGQQLESDAFNRRFRVRGGDPSLTVQLLDARLQQHLLEHYPKRSLWVSGNLAVLGGQTDREDASLYGPIRALPGLQADATDLLNHVPAQFWRAIGLPTDGAAPQPPPMPPPAPGSGPPPRPPG